MNLKSYLLATVALFLFIIGFGRMLHSYGLDDIYQSTSSLWRSEMQLKNNMTYFWISRFILSALIAYFFTLFFSHGGLKNGIKFGLFLGLMAGILSATWYFWLPVPIQIGAYWFFISFIEIFVGCALVGLIYRK